MKSASFFIASFLLFLFATSQEANAQWAQTNGPHNITITAMASIGTDLFVGGDGVSRSTNNGVTWTSVDNGITDGFINALTVTDSNTLSPMLFASNTAGDVYRSSDEGQSWVTVDSGLSGLVTQTLASSGSDLYAGFYQGVYRTTDHGTSWSNASNGLPSNPDISNFAITGDLSASPVIFAGTSKGMFQSSDKGMTWTAETVYRIITFGR
jgi:hypothetical protein